jgi:DNA (cytosine-5)-methyltransferase 1
MDRDSRRADERQRLLKEIECTKEERRKLLQCVSDIACFPEEFPVSISREKLMERFEHKLLNLKTQLEAIGADQQERFAHGGGKRRAGAAKEAAQEDKDDEDDQSSVTSTQVARRDHNWNDDSSCDSSSTHQGSPLSDDESSGEQQKRKRKRPRRSIRQEESETIDFNSQHGGPKNDGRAQPEPEDVIVIEDSTDEEVILANSNDMPTTNDGHPPINSSSTAGHRTGEDEDDEATEEEDDEEEEDKYDDLDLEDYDGTEDDISKIEKSKLVMAIQGFRSKARNSSDNRMKSSMNGDSSEELTPAVTDGPDSVRYQDRIFHKGRCYNYKGTAADSKEIESIVGILGFVSDKVGGTTKLARCVLVVPFEDTILGTEEADDEHYSADYTPSPYFQVHEQFENLPLSDLETESSNVESIPLWIYDPQVPGCWQRFGYFLDKKRAGVTRRGRRTEIRLLDLFAGAGGMHQGYKNAGGFATAMAVENDPWAVQTLTANNAEIPIYPGDITDYIKYIDTPAGRKALGPISCAHCSSPCQGFSGANRNGGVNDHANNELSLTFIDAVRITRCTAAVFENVLGMWRRENIHYLKRIAKELLRLGYQVRCAKLQACDYGDPQKRPRLFLFASHVSAPPPIIPPVTHGDGPNLLPYVTVKDAVSGLENPDGTSRFDLPNMVGSTTSLRPGEHGKVRLDPDGLAPAIRSMPPFHYAEDRCIFVREAASIQNFPEDYAFHGKLSDQYRQVGNSVPIELATAVAQSMRQLLVYEYARSDS